MAIVLGGFGKRQTLALGFALAVAWFIVEMIGRSTRLWLALRHLPPESIEHRIRCVCPPARIMRHGTIANVPFEPIICSAPFVAECGGLIALSFVAAVPAFGVLYFVGRQIGVTDSSLPFTILTSSFLGCFAVQLLWPTYLRIVPGRVDVMRFSAIKRRGAVVASYNLRRGVVLVDLRRSLVFLGNEDGIRQLSLAMTPRKTYVVYALLLAAFSTHDPPPLPDDQLLG